MTKEDDEDVNIVAHFLTFIGKEAYSLLKTWVMPEKPVSLPYATLKELLLDYVKYTNFECGKGGEFHKIFHQDIENSTKLLCYPNPMRTQRCVDNMVFLNDSHISDEIPCKSEEDMLSEHNYDRKPDVVLIDVDFSNDPSLSNDIHNKFEETNSEESNLDFLMMHLFLVGKLFNVKYEY
ncbi:unnamed protein product [Schistosoma mattheei]|uniref:Uncharacterized protein n=1 Tax=Schistosoma mattheei TaxID=31246 RepID=A0A183PNI9_9TREM|nr:unnamed protein product [Schistosoma mattheei]